LGEGRETVEFKITLPPALEEKVKPDVLIAALTYKLYREAREVRQVLEKILNMVAAAGEIYPVETAVLKEVKVVKPGGRWRGVSIYNRGPSTCWVQLSKQMLAYKPVKLEAGDSKSWFFLTPVIEAVYVKSSGKSVLELEFTR